MDNELQTRVQEYKDFHEITSDLNQQFKLDNGLFVSYNDRWIPLTKKNNSSFYAKTTLKKHGVDFMRAVGLMPPRHTPQYHAPTMNELRDEMMGEYSSSTTRS